MLRSGTRKLAIIGAGQAAGIYMVAARWMGVETHCFASEQGSTTQALADYFYPIDIFDVDAIAAQCRQIGVGGVVSTSDITTESTARVANALGLRGMTLEEGLHVTDKYWVRSKVAAAAGVRQPRFAKVMSFADLEAAHLSFPFILKPRQGCAKRGVMVVNDASQMDAAYQYTMDDAHAEGMMLAEEFVPEETIYLVESLSFQGMHHMVQIAEMVTSGPPHCVEMVAQAPAPISEILQAKVTDAINSILNAIGHTDGPCHTELIIHKDEVYLVEVNPRMGGWPISYPMVDIGIGISYHQCAIEAALGSFDKTMLTPRHRGSSGIVCVFDKTRQYQPVYRNCENYRWCWQKCSVTEQLQHVTHTNMADVNSFIYWSVDGCPELMKDTTPKNAMAQRRILVMGLPDRARLAEWIAAGCSVTVIANGHPLPSESGLIAFDLDPKNPVPVIILAQIESPEQVVCTEAQWEPLAEIVCSRLCIKLEKQK